MKARRTRLKGKSCRNLYSERGYATIWFLISMVALTLLMAVVMTFSFQTIQQNKVKNALNHAVKAAAMQIDEQTFVRDAKVVINREQSREAFDEFLSANLGANEDVEVVEFEIVDESEYAFPYTVERTPIRFTHTFEAAGVMAVARVELPSLWGAKERTLFVPAAAEVAVEINS